jgi:hypothetical protein
MKIKKWDKIKASRSQFPYIRDAIAFLSNTVRGKKFDLPKCKTEHNNYEWIFCKLIEQVVSEEGN